MRVCSDTKLGYIIKPANDASAQVSLDLVFTDGGRLKDVPGAVDQYGVAINPLAQGKGGYLKPGEWNYVEVNLGAIAEGRIVKEIVFGFETDNVSPGQAIEASLDAISIFGGDGDFGKVNAYVALYSGQGRLVSVDEYVPMDLHAFATAILDAPITVDMLPGGDDCYVKLFLWEVDTDIPVREAVTIPLIPD